MNTENSMSAAAKRPCIFSGIIEILSSRWLMIFFSLVLWTGMVNPGFSSDRIFSWIDAAGVRHYSNKPPAGIDETSLATTDEIPYDPEADEQRSLQDQQWREQEEARNMEERLSKAEEKAEEAKRLADESARKAEQLQGELDQVREERTENSTVYVPVWPYRPHRPRPPGYHPDRPGGKPDRPRPTPLPEGEQSGVNIKVQIDKK